MLVKKLPLLGLVVPRQAPTVRTILLVGMRGRNISWMFAFLGMMKAKAMYGGSGSDGRDVDCT